MEISYSKLNFPENTCNDVPMKKQHIYRRYRINKLEYKDTNTGNEHINPSKIHLGIKLTDELAINKIFVAHTTLFTYSWNYLEITVIEFKCVGPTQ